MRWGYETLEVIRKKHRARMDDENWKTINGTHVEVGGEGEIVKGPIGLKTVSVERVLKKRVRKAESEIRHNDIESAIMFGPDGKELTRATGERDCCRIPSEEECSLKGATLTHNHPANGCLSDEDIAVFEYRGLKEMRAVCRNGTNYSLKLVDDTKNTGKTFTKDYRDAIGLYMSEKCDKIWEEALKQNQSGKISAEGLNVVASRLNKMVFDYQRQWLKENSEKYGYRYTEEKDEG